MSPVFVIFYDLSDVGHDMPDKAFEECQDGASAAKLL
jgi:hypothetical protein